MPLIPFIDVRFFPPEETRERLEKRFIRHLRLLRCGLLAAFRSGNHSLPEGDTDKLLSVEITHIDRIRVQRRAGRIIERRQAASGLAHLVRADRERLTTLHDGVNLVELTTEHRADEIAAALHEEMPWMDAATEQIWHAMRRSVRDGTAGLRLPPILLDGPPGIGKSFWARRLGEFLSVPTTVIEATNENASFGIVGSQKGWSNAAPGRILETILQSRVANPVVVVDEVEKAGTAKSVSGRAFGLTEALLPLLEPMTAQNWSCPYYQVKFDMSWVAWVLTSNDFRSLPEPLLSRCPPIRLRHLTQAELVKFIRREGHKKGIDDTGIEAAVEAFTRAGGKDQSMSLRTAARVIQRAYDLERHPILH